MWILKTFNQNNKNVEENLPHYPTTIISSEIKINTIRSNHIPCHGNGKR